MSFNLHPRLVADTYVIGDLTLCRLLLMNDMAFPWLILVPRILGAREVIDLSRADRHQLSDELALAQEVLQRLHEPHKLNLGALGNVVEQLHIHVIARKRYDSAWPQPVWGKQPACPYPEQEALRRLACYRDAFKLPNQP